jgi:hypothetical protein
MGFGKFFPYIIVFTKFFSALQVALLTIYDMCKDVDRGLMMGNVHSSGEEWWEVSGGRQVSNYISIKSMPCIMLR